jgi:hypothetical protein
MTSKEANYWKVTDSVFFCEKIRASVLLTLAIKLSFCPEIGRKKRCRVGPLLSILCFPSSRELKISFVANTSSITICYSLAPTKAPSFSHVPSVRPLQVSDDKTTVQMEESLVNSQELR